MIIFIRPPITDKYNEIATYEDPILSSFLGFMEATNQNIPYKIFDFVLTPNIKQEDFLSYAEDATYVIISRERGAIPHYASRLGNLIYEKYNKENVIIYGQISSIKAKISKFISPKIKLIIHDEIKLAEALNLKIPSDYNYENKSLHLPYYEYINMEKHKIDLFIAAIETTRGCVFPCDFCFVNNEKTFSKKWQTRNNDIIIRDIESYYKKGIRKFFFLDLEFLGPNNLFHKTRKDLFLKIKEHFNDINIMLYCRADNLLKFNEFKLMKSSGVYNIYVGAESFFPQDLIALKKIETSEQIISSVQKLLDEEINVFLSLITFNRNTTEESLEYNLNTLDQLLNHKNAACLRIPTAFVNIEHSWNNKNLEKYKFSDNSYTKWTLYFQLQSTEEYVFNSRFEPLIEVYRVVAYENERKVTELNLCFDGQLNEVKRDIETWFSRIDKYSIFIMKHLLEKFKNSEIQMNNLLQNIHVTFQMLQLYNDKYLPTELRSLCTKEETLEWYSYSTVRLGDHGFDNVIPPIQKFLDYTMNKNTSYTKEKVNEYL